MNASQRATIGKWVKKEDFEYPFEDGEVINYTLEKPFRDFTMKPMVTLKTEFNGCDKTDDRSKNVVTSQY